MKIHRLMQWWVYTPKISVNKRLATVRLGSAYGGWRFVDRSDLSGATILSCGLGEDASFDVEFAARYRARVVLVDPTPRAIRHFDDIDARFGQAASCGYSDGGKQLVTSYDLSAINCENLVLVPKALWTENGNVRFYLPKNVDHVSHSIVNFQNDYSSETAYIDVQSITIDTLIADQALEHIALMKLDIEGAEIAVLADMLDKGIFPNQLLIEFDGLGKPSRRAKESYERTDRKLRDAGYDLVHFDGATNFLYVREG
jgi:FkbM family methyltransferase